MSDAPEPEAPTLLLERSAGAFSLRIPRLRLEVVDGPDAGKRASPEIPVARIGTHPASDLVLTDPTVSRLHCEVRAHGGLVRIRDHGSTNGTRYGDARIHDVEVPTGSLVQVGRTTLRIDTERDALRVPLSGRRRFGALVGRSPAMREVFALLERIAPTETTVLLEGESGTGKELAAEAIHAASARSDGPLVVFDCGAVARDLVESELFGHVRGAFTGAIADRRGVFEEAASGTLFLDEIGELPLDLQPKLLRAIEKREIRPVGESASRPVDVRIVAATHRTLEEEVNAGRFREDLYYRLAVVRVRMPSLRSRPEDIPPLAAHFLAQLAPEAPPELSEQALRTLGQRAWPGNVRELRNVLERALSLGTLADGGGEAFDADGPAPRLPPPGADTSLPFRESRERAMEAFERAAVEAALERSGGNVSAAARAMGVNRKFLHRLLRKHKLRSEDP